MKAREGEHPFGDTGQLILLVVFAAVWVADSFILHRTTFLSHYLPLYIRIVFMVLCLAVAFYSSSKGHVVVSHERKPEGLVTNGIFRHVRHPLYLASIITYLGVTVATLSIASAAVLLVIVWFYNFIAEYEESWLEAKFGEPYRQYKKRTGKWLPKLGGQR